MCSSTLTYSSYLPPNRNGRHRPSSDRPARSGPFPRLPVPACRFWPSLDSRGAVELSEADPQLPIWQAFAQCHDMDVHLWFASNATPCAEAAHLEYGVWGGRWDGGAACRGPVCRRTSGTSPCLCRRVCRARGAGCGRHLDRRRLCGRCRARAYRGRQASRGAA